MTLKHALGTTAEQIIDDNWSRGLSLQQTLSELALNNTRRVESDILTRWAKLSTDFNLYTEGHSNV
jgi:hypothetical protein